MSDLSPKCYCRAEDEADKKDECIDGDTDDGKDAAEPQQRTQSGDGSCQLVLIV